jgi:hypothetical protein
MLSRTFLAFVLLTSTVALAEEHSIHVQYREYVSLDSNASAQEFLGRLTAYGFKDIKWTVRPGDGRYVIWNIDADFESDIKQKKNEYGNDEWVTSHKNPQLMTDEEKQANNFRKHLGSGVTVVSGPSTGPKVTFTSHRRRERGYVMDIMGPWYRPDTCTVCTSSADALCVQLGMARKDLTEFDTEAKMQIAAAVVLCLSDGGDLFCGTTEKDPLPAPVTAPTPQPVRSPYVYPHQYPRSNPMHYRRFR